MTELGKKLAEFYQSFGKAKKMVLSTSSEGKVSSRMMSVVLIDGKFYFQTDMNMRKYAQLKANPHAALCIDNIQIEGICREVGRPLENEAFRCAFEECYKGSFDMYSSMESERVFELSPDYIERWIYIDGKPYNEEETRRRNSAYATAVEKIYHSKQFNIIFGIYLVFCIVFLFRSGGIIRLLKRSVIILLIPIALMAVSFGIFYVATIIRSVKESKLSTGWFILSVPTAFKLKKYKSDPQKTEEYLLKKIHKYDGKAVCSLYLEALFNHYISEAELQKAAGLMEYADRIRGKSKVSDRITADMDFAMSIENKHCFETVRIFEENEDPFSEDALSGVMKLTNFLNTLGEYKFALGRYDEALDIFIKRKDCMLRYNETAPKPLQYDDDSFSAVSTDIAKCLIKLGLYEEAKGYLTEAKSLSSRKGIYKICGRLAEEMEIY